jgi:hypothetical protein
MTYPPCPNPACEHTLCWLDRTYDECPACNAPLPDHLRVDMDFNRLPVCMCGSVHVPGEIVTHPIITR